MSNMKRFRSYCALAIAATIITVISSCAIGSIAQTEQPTDLFTELVPAIEEVSAIPVLIPDEVVPRTEDTLYPEIFDLTQQSYEIAYGKVPNCSNAGFCREGWIQGYQVGVQGYKSESIDELIEERQEHLEKATKTSEDSIENVFLEDGTSAVVLPWIGYTHPGATEVIFEKDGYRYVFAVVMADNDYVVALANSAVD